MSGLKKSVVSVHMLPSCGQILLQQEIVIQIYDPYVFSKTNQTLNNPGVFPGERTTAATPWIAFFMKINKIL